MDRVDPAAATITLDASGETTAAGDAPALAAGDQVGRYVIRRCIDRGGMGVVYEASDDALGRRVAIKLLAGGGDAARLVREARAAAGLSHPNVVSIYEVGAHATGPFLAMELVEGATLGQWLAAKQRTWREIVDKFREAGRGLAAAHDKGVVHRDVKPDNILVGDDRVRVADFGLARGVIERGDAADAGAAGDRITHAGTVIGTPRYMSPEQRAGRDADARSDQYSFCVALGEALERVPGVPRRLHAIVGRGRLEEPAQRFPSMAALLAELDRLVRPRAPYVIAGGLAVLALGGAAFAWWTADDPEAACAGAARQLAGVWDRETAAGIERALAGVPYGATLAKQVAADLDRYATDWIAMHEGACRATRVDGDQSEAMLDRRMACLDERRRALAALTTALARADAKVVERAVTAAANLPPIAACGNLRALLAAPPSAPARSAAQDELIAARLHVIAGKPDEARAAAERARAAARTAGMRDQEGHALLVRGRAEIEQSDYNGALATLREAEQILAAAGQVTLRVEALRYLSRGYLKLGRVAEAEQVLDVAFEAHAASPDRVSEADLLWARALVSAQRGDYEASRVDLERSLAVATAALGPDAEPLSKIHRSLGIVYRRLGKLEDALANARRAFEIVRHFGDNHPATAMGRGQVAVVLVFMRRYDEARRELETAAAVLREVRGEDSEELSTVLNDLGSLYARTGRFIEAVEHFRQSLAIKKARGADATATLVARANLGTTLITTGELEEGERVLRRVLDERIALLGADHTDVAIARQLLGRALAHRGRFAEAMRELEAALAAYRKTYGPEHDNVADVLAWMADAERDHGKFAAALAHDEQSAAIYAKTRKPDDASHAEAKVARARDLLGLRQHARARALAEEALAELEKHPDAPEPIARAKFALARALWEGGSDRARAHALATAARTFYGPTGMVREIAELDAWLASHRAP